MSGSAAIGSANGMNLDNPFTTADVDSDLENTLAVLANCTEMLKVRKIRSIIWTGTTIPATVGHHHARTPLLTVKEVEKKKGQNDKRRGHDWSCIYCPCSQSLVYNITAPSSECSQAMCKVCADKAVTRAPQDCEEKMEEKKKNNLARQKKSIIARVFFSFLPLWHLPS